MTAHVLHVVAWYPTPDDGVFGTFVREHVRAAAGVSTGAIVHIRLTGRGSSGRTWIEGEPLPMIRVQAARTPVGLGRAIAGLRRAATELERASRPFDLVHVHLVAACVPGLVLARGRRIPLVLTEHWTGFRPGAPRSVPRPLVPVVRACFHHADVVLPVSMALRDGILGLAPKARTRVVGNVVDTSLFAAETKRDSSAATSAPVVLTACKLIDTKSVDSLLRVFPTVRAAVPGTRLVVIGDGPERTSLEALSRDLDLTDIVTFTGLLRKMEVAKLMREASVFALPSSLETFSVVCAEALASGTPVVATRSGGPEEFLAPQSGIVVPVGDEDALADGLIDALSRSWDHAAIAKSARDRFSPESIGAALQAVYEDVLPGR